MKTEKSYTIRLHLSSYVDIEVEACDEDTAFKEAEGVDICMYDMHDRCQVDEMETIRVDMPEVPQPFSQPANIYPINPPSTPNPRGQL